MDKSRCQYSIFDTDFEVLSTGTIGSSRSVAQKHECKIIDLTQMFPNPISKPKNNNVGKEQTVYPVKDKDQLQAIALWLKANKDPKYYLAFAIGVNTGLRANELLKLRWSDVLWSDKTVKYIDDIEDTTDSITVYQSKTKKKRKIFLNSGCLSALKWYVRKTGRQPSMECFLFPSREGGAIKVDTLRKVLKEAALACGVRQNIGTHSLRKTWGWSEYTSNPTLQTNRDIGQLQMLFGHSSPQTTLRYLGIMDEEKKALYHDMSLCFEN